MRAPRTRLDLTAQRFGRLLVLHEAPRRADRRVWDCRCDCGTELTVAQSRLRSGETRSCGCLHREFSATLAARRISRQLGYMTWRTMYLRCTDPNHHDYARFGGRGIRVCPAWDDFATFMDDLGPRPSLGHRLARLDETADFTPQNCLWADHTARRHLQCAQSAHPAIVLPQTPAAIACAALPAPTAPATIDNDGVDHLDDGWLSVSAAAAATGLSRATIRHWVQGGRLQSTQRNGMRAVRLGEVRAAQAQVHLGTVLPEWRADPARCGARLRFLREAAGISQQALATASGLTNAAISLLEHGGQAPSVATVRALADALQIAPERFVAADPLGLSLLTAAEAAARLDVPLERVQIWLKQGHLAGTKVSGRWRIPAIAVAELERSGRLRGRSRRLDPRYRG